MLRDFSPELWHKGDECLESMLAHSGLVLLAEKCENAGCGCVGAGRQDHSGDEATRNLGLFRDRVQRDLATSPDSTDMSRPLTSVWFRVVVYLDLFQ